MAELRDDEFFVGYLALPPRLRRFAFAAAVSMLALGAGLAVAVAALREPPARSAQASASLVGRIEARAYGVLWTLEAGRQAPVLLTRGGKFGAPDAVKALDGQIVRLDGLLLERDGYRLLEVSKVDVSPVVPDATRAQLARLTPRVLGPRTLRGEIVDIKCWLGRMKPGDGRTHRACAQFCIAGGIPPVLVAREGGGTRHYVLTDLAGAAVNEAVLPFVAEPVELTGEAAALGGMLFLRVDPARIGRL